MPSHIFAEHLRLSCLGLAASNAKQARQAGGSSLKGGPCAALLTDAQLACTALLLALPAPGMAGLCRCAGQHDRVHCLPAARCRSFC